MSHLIEKSIAMMKNDLVIRIDDGNGNKRFIQTHIDTDTLQWVNKAPQKGYGLFERGAINQNATVLVVEGEKAVIRAAKRFPELSCNILARWNWQPQEKHL